ncbi:meiosis-specific cyclin Rem1 [Sparganum proliferum]
MAENLIPPAGFILAANKFDLVRRREVNSEDARQFANAHNAKFLEISAALGHMLPELLLTVITHLCELDESKLGPRRAFNHPQHHSTATSSPSSPRTGASARREQAVYTSSTNSSAGAAAASSGSVSGVYASRGASSKGGLAKFFRRHFTRSSTGCDSSD